MMRWLWNAPGAMVAVACMGVIMISTARQSGANSRDFWWSLLICIVVLAAVLTFRYFTQLRSGSPGPHPNNHQPSSLN